MICASFIKLIQSFNRKSQKLESLAYIFVADSTGLSSFKFVQWAPKDASFLRQSAFWPFKVIQGHRSLRRSMILVPIESAINLIISTCTVSKDISITAECPCQMACLQKLADVVSAKLVEPLVSRACPVTLTAMTISQGVQTQVFLRARSPPFHPTNSVKALKE